MAARLLALLMTAVLPVTARAEFALRDGDTVVFLGDSITAARTYGKIIEDYTLLRFPQRKVRFINAGIGGDTMAGGLARLDRDVFDRKATVVTVAFGTNDIGWGLHADAEHKKKYLDAVRGLVERCKVKGVRVYLCSAAVTGADPAESEKSFLQAMCDEGMALSKSLGGDAIDVQRSMRAVQKRVWAANAALKDGKGRVSMHLEDGTHLNDLGQLAMAFAILKGLGAPAEVSSATIDAAALEAKGIAGCAIGGIRREGDSLEFTRLDEGLPVNFGLFGALNFRFVPVHEELNRYLLAVKGLPAGRHELLAGGRKIGVFSAEQLAAGLNISSLTPDAWQPGGPWDARATLLKSITEARNQVSMAELLSGIYATEGPERKLLEEEGRKVNEAIEELQRALVRPTPYRFVVRPEAKAK